MPQLQRTAAAAAQDMGQARKKLSLPRRLPSVSEAVMQEYERLRREKAERTEKPEAIHGPAGSGG